MAKKVVKVPLFQGVYDRLKRAADSRGVSVADYCEHLISWHTPAPDNEIQQLQARIKMLEAELKSGV